MKYVVFGGAGFIGSAICDLLLKEGHSLRIFERVGVTAYRIFKDFENVEWVNGDILNTQDVNAAIKNMDGVIHLVSTTLPKSSNEDPIYDVQTNIIASLNILNAMRQLNVNRIVFISSGGTVYGNPIHLPITENHQTEPNISYGITKLTIEKYLLMYEKLYGIKSIILRVANPYGERQKIETAQGAVGIFLTKTHQGLPIEIWGDGSVERDYIHVSDVANAFSCALKYAGKCSIFNIGCGLGVSINSLLDTIEKVTSQKTQRIYKDARVIDVPVNYLDNQLAKKELGWFPKLDLEEGLRLTSDWIYSEINKTKSNNK